jgi:hypothetical protein
LCRAENETYYTTGDVDDILAACAGIVQVFEPLES